MLSGKLVSKSWIALRFGEAGVEGFASVVATAVELEPSADDDAAPTACSAAGVGAGAPSILGGAVDVAEAGVTFWSKMFSHTHVR